MIGDGKPCRLAAVAQARRRFRNRAERATDRDQAATGSEHLQALLVDFTADHLQHDIDTAIVGYAHALCNKIGFTVIDGHISAEFTQSANLILATGSRNYFAAQIFSDLDRCISDTAAARLNEQPL